MMRSWTLFVSLCMAAMAVYISYIHDYGKSIENQYPLIILIGINLLVLLYLPRTKTLFRYYVCKGIFLLFGITAIITVNRVPSAQVLILIVLLCQTILMDPYPLNYIESSGIILIVITVNLYIMVDKSIPVIDMIKHFAIIIIPALVLNISGSLMMKYRELIISVEQMNNRLKDSIVNLTRTNSAYLNYAAGAQEQGVVAERQRITRDIHDIVGYTLTNNMMLMEAALDIMKENPLALPSIIETARLNAQEGLSQVRNAMYQFRKQDNSPSIGLKAIMHLGKIFELSTSIKVSYNFGNIPISYEIDSAIIHLVQEALVNSFRHSNGTEIQISFWYGERILSVYVQDNGMGTDNIVEGIGIKGMRERIEQLGGTLETVNVADGFLVKASIPLEAI